MGTRVPCFVVNLTRDKAKREYMERLLSGSSVLDLIIFEAFDGSVIRPSSKIEYYDHLKCAEAIGRRLTRGEIGCAMSHLKIYNYIVDNNINSAVVLEDDVVLEAAMPSVVQHLVARSSEFSIVLLGSHVSHSRYVDVSLSNEDKLSIGESFFVGVPCAVAYGTYGYFVTNRGARQMIDVLNKIYLPIDHYSGSTKFVDVKVVVPSVVKVNIDLEEDSNIDAERRKFMRSRNSSNYRLRKKIVINLGLYGFYGWVKRRFCPNFIREFFASIKL